VRESEVAAIVLTIRAICRRFRITGLLSTLLGKDGEDRIAKTNFTLAPCHPEPDGESFNQSKSIIGAAERVGNHSEGSRTSEVISVTE